MGISFCVGHYICQKSLQNTKIMNLDLSQIHYIQSQNPYIYRFILASKFYWSIDTPATKLPTVL